MASLFMQRKGAATGQSWFVRKLDEIRELRNAVIHFDPDGLTDEQTAQLTRFRELIRTLRQIAPPIT